MIIRSKNKKAIRNFNLISDLVISKDSKGDWEIIACYPYFAQSDCGFAVIGTYSTEEKAIKVLDMIEKLYVESVWTDERMIIANRVGFEMPQDSEV